MHALFGLFLSLSLARSIGCVARVLIVSVANGDAQGALCTCDCAPLSLCEISLRLKCDSSFGESKCICCIFNFSVYISFGCSIYFVWSIPIFRRCHCRIENVPSGGGRPLLSNTCLRFFCVRFQLIFCVAISHKNRRHTQWPRTLHSNAFQSSASNG